MSQHQAFRRSAVPPEIAQKLETITIPAPTRGIIQNENEAYMQPGGAVICDNWRPTMRGISLRGGHVLWCQLPEMTPVISAFTYASGNIQNMYAGNINKLYDVTTVTPILIKSGQTSGNYAASQLANAQGDWMIVVNDAGNPPLRYGPSSGSGLTWETLGSGYVPPAGKPSMITGIPPAGLSYVCKYRNRYFFVENGSMNAWYLPLNAVGGALAMIPLSGAATKGGKLLACFSWSIDAGDGIDDKIVFMTDLGELLIFTGSDPSVAASWRQEGRYEVSPPLGMNAHLAVGGDVLIATVDGIVPLSGAITKTRTELELAAVTRAIKPMWREHVLDKREHPWTMCKWDEYGAIFTTFPGGNTGKQLCLATNAATGAHARYTGWDVMCFIRMRGDMFFGTQLGAIMQADRTGYDNGAPYVATLVGGWEMFHSPSQTVTWRQARASFSARAGEPFQPQLSATTDYVVVLPQPPLAGLDPGVLDLWDQGLWGPNVSKFNPLWLWAHAYTVGNKAYDGLTQGNYDCAVAHTSPASGTFAAYRTANPTHWTLSAVQPTPSPVSTPAERAAYAQWDQPTPGKPVVRNTGWVSIGLTGFSHAPIVQVTVAQQAKPEVDLINVAATFERDGVVV